MKSIKATVTLDDGKKVKIKAKSKEDLKEKINKTLDDSNRIEKVHRPEILGI